MLWRPFLAGAKFNDRSIYSRILARVCAVAMATGLVKLPWQQGWLKTRLKNGFCLFEKKKSSR